jgi:hypothetical protein
MTADRVDGANASGASGTPGRVSRLQREALDRIRRADPGEAYLVSCESFSESGGVGVRWTQAFINFRTARALERRGLVRIDGRGEDATVYLTTDASGDSAPGGAA